MRGFIVVGAGAGGPVVAKQLAARGLDVLLLEAGPAWPDIDRQWSHHENGANDPVANVHRLLKIAVITDDDVVPENRVLLSTAMTPDAHGPVARIELRRRTARTLANRDYLAARADEILKAAGAREIVRINWAPVLIHIHSTMRMGPS